MTKSGLKLLMRVALLSILIVAVSALTGQEFVIRENDRIEDWAKSLVEGAQIDH
jgi:hypothetical protein